MLFVSVRASFFKHLLFGRFLLLDRVREQLMSNVREKLLEAQIEATLQSVVTDDAFVGSGQDDTATLTAFLWTERQIFIENQLCFVLDLDCGTAILIDLSLLHLPLHNGLVFLLALRDQLLKQADIFPPASYVQLFLK